MKNLVLFILAVFTFLGCSNKTYKEKVVTKKEYKEKWPFTVDTAKIGCYKDDDISSPVVIIKDKVYGLTGFADNKYGQKDINALNEVWRYDERPAYKSLKMRVNLGDIESAAKKLCE